MVKITKERPIEKEMKTSYMDYAMSVIVGRALPDVRDGLKPVHRRIVYAMLELGNLHNKPYKKSARVVGEALGKFHPHGDVAIYDALVRMAQDFSMRYPLIDGQGNFGSVDGDMPAAMRYTEVRLSRLAEDLVSDIDKDTVSFMPNFDGSLKEPTVLPSKIPNLLINGSSGIAVGMSTNIPPHNITEIINALVQLIRNPWLTNEELLKILPGPDFPTGGVIVGKRGIIDAYMTGKGIISIRGKVQIDEKKNRIIISEIPYQVNKSNLITRIANLVKKKRIPHIIDLKDLSSRDGIEIVITVRKGIDPKIVLNQLYFHTDLEKTFGVINIALVNGVPKTLTLRDMLLEFIKFRKEVVTRRSQYDLQKAQDRKHIVEGLLVALNNIDDIVERIRKSKDTKEAKGYLMESYQLTERQANAILDMRLSRLTALERTKLDEELKKLGIEIDRLESILGNEKILMDVIVNELLEIRDKYGDERKTEIIEEPEEIVLEQLVPNREMVVTITNNGYIKRVPLENYRKQKRGGKGIVAAETYEEDVVRDLITARNHDYLLIFSDKGILRWLKVYKIPETSRYAKGKPLASLLEIPSNERITAWVKVRQLDESGYLFFVTKNGLVKRTRLSAYSKVRKGGIIGLKLVNNDTLEDVKLTNGSTEIFIATKNGLCIHFDEKDIREMGRVSQGVRGIRLRGDDRVVGMATNNGTTLFTVTEKGYGKRTALDEYRTQSRGGRGVRNIITDKRSGKVVDIAVVDSKDELIFITSKGRSIRISANDVRVIGRNTRGVRIMRLNEGEKIVGFSRIRNRIT